MTIKHGGKTYPVDVDVTAPVSVFKDSIYRVTGVPAGESWRLNHAADYRSHENHAEGHS